MAFKIQQVDVQPMQIFVRLIYFNCINCENHTFLKNEIILSLLLDPKFLKWNKYLNRSSASGKIFQKKLVYYSEEILFAKKQEFCNVQR